MMRMPITIIAAAALAWGAAAAQTAGENAGENASENGNPGTRIAQAERRGFGPGGRRGGRGGRGLGARIGAMFNRGGGAPVGEVAPDFNLAPLKFYELKAEKTDSSKKNAEVLYNAVRLSSFKGQRPVALIFGSYT